MSRPFVAGYFPEITRTFPRVLQLLFPDDIAQLCPEFVPGSVRHPSLAVFALGGIWIGAQGAYQYKTLRWWRAAFGCFGLMNFFALFLHCLVTITPGRTEVEEQPLLWSLDCLFTGLSSCAIVGACLDRLIDSARFWKAVTFAICLTSALLATVIFCRHTSTIGLELFYLVPLAFAGQVCFAAMLKELRPACLATVVLGGLLPVAGVVFDRYSCQIMRESVFYDLLGAPALMFAGCDVAFMGLKMWIDSIFFRRKSSDDLKRQ
ncbi:hypothetical protein FisN_17Hu164 [Fistulifera solaris]|uniref:Uncharacterized protein n=1 Tax=Fistulifera solaris TaxID=1519565 RepID=A0A1Z5JHJ4_FISSO|nr:hypothetical protein FisN_17Hu164 [Fistulifera solaris]|eukprot:GAX13231.1 hypothetical protein FisN_17Hu164 [Fistulifera solaris]